MKKTLIAALAAAAIVPAGRASAQSADKLQLSDYVQSAKLSGDIRLRHDAQLGTAGRGSRNRERFRARLGLTATGEGVTAILRLASGTGSQTSANQTEQNQFSQKGIYIDLAEVRYAAGDALTLEGGRMNNPFWSGWESSLVWDPDLNPEGYAQELKLPYGLFARAGQFPINESASFANAGPWMFAERVGATIPLGGATATLAVDDNYFTNLRRHPTDAVQTNFGNTTEPSGLLASRFHVVHGWGSVKGKAGALPVEVSGGYVDNVADSIGSRRFGFIAGAQVGKASKARTWEAAYYYKYLEADATPANQVDDDFGPGGTNLAGHLVWLAYAPKDNVVFKLSYYETRVLGQLTSTGFTSSRWMGHMMADAMVKF
ncbi:MAG: putative porin [Elusimicrobia bacterium]|nr:putative porin [Elusimicrobiota bacterium]